MGTPGPRRIMFGFGEILVNVASGSFATRIFQDILSYFDCTWRLPATEFSGPKEIRASTFSQIQLEFHQIFTKFGEEFGEAACDLVNLVKARCDGSRKYEK